MYEILHHRFWALLHSTLTSDRNVRVLSLEGNEARLAIAQKRLLVVLIDERPEERVALQNWARVLLEETRAPQVDIVVLTPSEEVDRTLLATELHVPGSTLPTIFTLNENGIYHEIANQRADTHLRELIEKSLAPGLANAATEALKQKVLAIVDAQNQKINEAQLFQRKMQEHSASATYILLGIIAAMYLVQMWFNSETYGPGLVRMGADSAILVNRGEYWRLVTSIFLHGGWLHIAANGYVLYALGTFFNKLIGNARFVTLFFLSGIAGSLASVMISQTPLSVGASGALWGLFGLSAALVIKPSTFLPDYVRQNLRNVTALNLAINLIFSFAVPMIDKWAHFGGGIAGLLIGLAYVYEPQYSARNLVHNVLAVAMSTLAALCIAINLYVETPWVMVRPLAFTDHSLFNDEIVVSIPSFLQLKKQSKDGAQFGDVYFDPRGVIYFDPYFILVHRQAFGAPIAPEELKTELEKQLGRPVQEREINGFVTFSSSYSGGEEKAATWDWYQIRGDWLYSIQVIGDPGAPPNLIDNLSRIVESIHSPIRI